MAADHPEPIAQTTPTESEATTLDDWRQRLLGSQEQLSAARAALRVLTREMAVMRRLFRFSFDGAAPTRPPGPGVIPRRSAARLAGELVYHVAVCENRGDHTLVAGWAFHPASRWNARDAAVTVLLRDGATTYYAATGKLLRPDVAAHYAAHPAQVSGGAHGLDGVGFACEIVQDSLPAGRNWQIALRLECGTMICEGPTDRYLRS